MPARQRAIGSSQQPIAIDDSDDGVTREPLPDHRANTGRTERFQLPERGVVASLQSSRTTHRSLM